MKKICILSNQHLTNNPRVWKEANTLAAAGYEVVILTVWLSKKKRQEDLMHIRHAGISYKGAINLVAGEMNPARRLYYRIKVRAAQELKKHLDIETTWTLTYAPKRMVKAALKENADLYIAHIQYGMYVGNRLIKKNKKVAYDIEDWYSRDYINQGLPERLLQSIEHYALEKGSFSTCPSLAMANALQQAYQIKNKPAVIYNGFSIKENEGLKTGQVNDSKLPSLVWFSQVVGGGRGLEQLVDSLTMLAYPVELHLIGSPATGFEEHLRSVFPFHSGHRIFFHPPVRHEQLIPVLSKFTIGLALEQKDAESRNTTITNKILQYIQAGLKVMATDTDGQKEVATYFPESTALVPVGETQAWAKAIEKLIHSGPVDQGKQFKVFKNVFSWEAQEPKLLECVKKALA